MTTLFTGFGEGKAVIASDTRAVHTDKNGNIIANAALNDLSKLTGLEGVDMPLFLQLDLYSAIANNDNNIATTVNFL